MPSSLNIRQIARVCHEANRALQEELGEHPSPPWEFCGADIQTSAVRGVEHATSGCTPEELHQSWCDTKAEQGWRYGPEKNADKKTHPCLVPYDDLPVEQRRKDYLFQGVVLSLTEDID